MKFGFHGGANALQYLNVRSYDPAKGRLFVDTYIGPHESAPR